ncbi:hypothetical protein EMIT0210MI2_10675 [Priestia megaterium]
MQTFLSIIFILLAVNNLFYPTVSSALILSTFLLINICSLSKQIIVQNASNVFTYIKRVHTKHTFF